MTDKTLQLKVILSGFTQGLTRPFENAIGSSKKLRKEIGATRAELKDLERQQGLLNRFGEMKSRAGELTDQLAAARAKATELGRAHAETEKPTRKLTREFARARGEVERLEREQGQHQRTLNATRRDLQAAGVSTRNYASHQRDLKRRIGETNQALETQKGKLAAADRAAGRRRDAQALNGKIGAFSGRLGVAGAAATAGGLAVGAPMYGEAVQAADLESQITDIRQKAGLPRSAAPGLLADFRAGAVNTNLLQRDFAATVDRFVSRGQGTTQAVRNATVAGRAATAWRSDAGDTADVMHAAEQQFGAEGARALDVVGFLGKKGGFEQADMARHFRSLAASYNQAWGQQGIEGVADLAAASQIVERVSGGPDQAATNLTNILDKLGSPETQKKFAKFGVNFEAAMEHARKNGLSPLQAAIEATEKATQGKEGKLGYLVEDVQARKALGALIRFQKEYKQFKTEALQAHGVVDQDFLDRQQDAAFKLQQFKVQADIARTKLGQQVLDAFAPMLPTLTKGVTLLGNFIEKNPGLTKVVARFAAFAVIGGAIAGAIALIGGAISMIGVPAALLVGLFAAFFALLPIGFKQLKAKWDAFTSFLGAVYGVWKAMTDGGLREILGRFASFSPLGAILTAFKPLEAWFIGLPAKFFSWGLNAVQGFINGLRAKKGEAAAAGGEAAGAAAEGAKTKLQINSPSRVFARIGDDTVAGLALGIRRSAKGPIAQAGALAAGLGLAMAGAAPAAPIIQRPTIAPSQRNAGVDRPQPALAADLARLARQPAASVGAAGERPPAPLVIAPSPLPARPAERPRAAPAPTAHEGDIHIHISAPAGADPAAIARAVRAELEDQRRKAAARRRSGLYDSRED